MNKLIITSINFKYDEGHENNYTTVDVNFNTVDVSFNMSGKIMLSRAEYDGADGDLSALKEAVLTKAVRQFGKELAE